MATEEALLIQCILLQNYLESIKKNRRSLPVICLSENISSITAIANDYDYDLIFKKQLEGIVNKGDLVIGVTTSGKSKNIIEALKYCKEKKIKSAAFLGSNKKV